VQQFRQSWLWFLLVSSTIISVLPILVFAIKGDMPLMEGVAGIGVIMLVTALNLGAFYWTRFETNISDKGISYRWWPFFRKFTELKWEDVEYVAMRKYSNFKFGYHSNKEFGKVHNVDGVNGYQVVLQNGKKYFFGTQKKLSVESVLQQTGKMKQ
jgi:hypothetical protein